MTKKVVFKGAGLYVGVLMTETQNAFPHVQIFDRTDPAMHFTAQEQSLVDQGLIDPRTLRARGGVFAPASSRSPDLEVTFDNHNISYLAGPKRKRSFTHLITSKNLLQKFIRENLDIMRSLGIH